MLRRTQFRCNTWAAIAIVSTLVCFVGRCSGFQTLGLTNALQKSPRALAIRSPLPPFRQLPSLRMQLSETKGGAGDPVLVVGEDRGLRLEVVKGLLDKGAAVRAMVKDMSSSDVNELRQLAGAEQRLSVVQGDVCKVEELVQGMNECRACISFDTARRSSQIKDVFFKIWDPTSEFLGAWGPSRPEVLPEEWGENFGWLDPGTDASHPWNTKFLAQCNLVEAAERTGCAHIVRVSDARVGAGPCDPRNVWHNLAQSMEVKWAHEGRISAAIVLRIPYASPVLTYAKLLPGELALHDVATELGASFTLLRASDIGDGAPPPCSERAAGLEHRAWAEEGPEWREALEKVGEWDGVVEGREMHATAVFSSIFLPLAALLWYGITSGQVTPESKYRYAVEALPVLGLLLTFASSALSLKLQQEQQAESENNKE